MIRRIRQWRARRWLRAHLRRRLLEIIDEEATELQLTSAERVILRIGMRLVVHDTVNDVADLVLQDMAGRSREYMAESFEVEFAPRFAELVKAQASEVRQRIVRAYARENKRKARERQADD